MAEFDPLAYLQSQYAAYLAHGILLNSEEMSVIESLLEDPELAAELRAFVAASRANCDRSLELQFASLAEAEAARDEALRLRDIAQASEAKVQELNAQLQQRAERTEAQLIREQEWRAQQTRTDLQRMLIYMLGGLVGVSLVLPYIATIFGQVPQVAFSRTSGSDDKVI